MMVIAKRVVIAAAGVYIAANLTSAVLGVIAFTNRTSDYVSGDFFRLVLRLESNSYAIGLGGLLVMGSLLIFQNTTRVQLRGGDQGTDKLRKTLRFLLVVVIGFAVLWIGSEMAVGREATRFEYLRYVPYQDLTDFDIGAPSDTFITLMWVRGAARAGLYGSLAIMVALWIATIYSDGYRRSTNSGSSDSDETVGHDDSG